VRTRSAVTLIEDNKLALIERHRAGKHYFAFPGGGVEEGETPEQAAVREAQEELGILVSIKQEAAEVLFNGNTQYYFLVEKISGEFGTGTGEEYGEYNPEHGTYYPFWMSLADVLTNNVLPRELADLVVHSAKEGWSPEPILITEKS